MGDIADGIIEQMQMGKMPSGPAPSRQRPTAEEEFANTEHVPGGDVLQIDVETYSSKDLMKSGVYAYTDAEDFEILLFAYAFDSGPIEIVDLAQGETLPAHVKTALLDPRVTKTAFNANFERITIEKHFGMYQPPSQWECTMVHAMYLGLPRSLDQVAKALQLDVQKDAGGKNLIKYFSVPCKPTKTNGQRTRNLPHHDEEKWQQFKDYCIQDVEVERSIKGKLLKFDVPDFEKRLWALDQEINDRGVQLDTDLVEHAIACDRQHKDKLHAEAVKLTGIDNPNSVHQLRAWVVERGVEAPDLNKDTVQRILDETEDETVRRVLQLRQMLAKTSVKKYEAMKRGLCKDGRIRGLLQFYGASRGGRWAGRLVQVHNLPQNKLDDIEVARNLLKAGQYEAIEMLFGNVSDILSQLIRTALIPSSGCKMVVSDFSAIEARVIAWLAGEDWRMKVFSGHGKIYEASASAMFNVPVESIQKGDPLRQKGKISELALGYQGSVGALKQMGALDMGLEEEELPELVKSWRKANPNIVQFWYDMENAALEAVREKHPVTVQQGIQFSCESGILFIKLPSGRRLSYARPKIETDERFGKAKLTYQGMGDQGKWTRLDTYGGKLVENIVQAVARDCLAESMVRLDDAGYPIIFHVHDENVLDVAADQEDALGHIEQIMGESLDWAPGLPLNADGFETTFYMKD